jgi:hypothetical protein
VCRVVPLRIQQQLHRRTLIGPAGLAPFHEPLLNHSKPPLNRDPAKRAVAVVVAALAGFAACFVQVARRSWDGAWHG